MTDEPKRILLARKGTLTCAHCHQPIVAGQAAWWHDHAAPVYCSKAHLRLGPTDPPHLTLLTGDARLF